MLHKKLGLKGNTQRTKEANERAAALRALISTSKTKTLVHSQERPYIMAAGVSRADYDFVGSGVVFYGGMLIERFDVE